MLYTKAIAPATFELLRRLQTEPAMRTSCLVGDAALALQLGHRRCQDLEILIPEVFSWELLEELLHDKYGFQRISVNERSLEGRIGETNILCREQQYTLVMRPVEEEGVRLCGIGDLAALIVAAIIADGSQEQMFADLACLSSQLSLKKILDYYEHKFPRRDVSNVSTAILCFDAVKFGWMPMLVADYIYDWELVANRLREMETWPEKIFNSTPLKQKFHPKTSKIAHKSHVSAN